MTIMIPGTAQSASHELPSLIDATEERGIINTPLHRENIYLSYWTYLGSHCCTNRVGTLQLTSNSRFITTIGYWHNNSAIVAADNSYLHPNSGEFPAPHIKGTMMLNVAVYSINPEKSCICKDQGTVPFMFPVPYTSVSLSSFMICHYFRRRHISKFAV